MIKRVMQYLLNTPEKYWFVMFGYHFHKSFLGTLLLIIGFITNFVPFIIFGTILIILSVSGHIYTQNKPYFKLWDKYK